MTILDTNQWLALALVLGTAIAILLLGIEIGRGLGPRRAGPENAGQLDDAAPVPYQVTRRGWLGFAPYGPPAAGRLPFQGAADPGMFELAGTDAHGNRYAGPAPAYSQPDLLDLLDDAFDIAERQVTARQAAAEVRAIEAEVDAHPEWWRTR